MSNMLVEHAAWRCEWIGESPNRPHGLSNTGNLSFDNGKCSMLHGVANELVKV